MTTQNAGTDRPVVVGVDGSGSSQRALEWAAAEARLRGLPLVIAHAGDLPHRGALTEDTADRAMREISAYGRQLLDEALATVMENIEDGIDVTTTLRESVPETLLVELSHEAELVVVGRSGHSALGRALLGSVSHRVAAHAACPIVIVDEDAPAADLVVVGVSPTPGGRAAIRFAAAEAAQRKVTLHLIRSWNEAALLAAGAGFGSTVPYVSFSESEQEVLDEAIALAHREFPDVTVTSELTPTSAYQVLPDAAEKAALLVVGRRRDEGILLPRLGALASWLAQHTACPLAIIPGHVDDHE